MTVSTFCDRPTGSPLLICSQEPHTRLFLPLVAWVECLANSPLRPKTGRFPFLPLLVSLFDVSSLVSNSLFVYYHCLDSPPTPPHPIPHPPSAICPTVVGSSVESAILQSKYLKKFTSSFLFYCLLGRGCFRSARWKYESPLWASVIFAVEFVFTNQSFQRWTKTSP